MYVIKEDIQWHISIWKDAQHHMPLENCKLKQTWALAGVAQLVEALSHTPKGCGFDSRSGHMPRLGAQSPIGVRMRGHQSMFLSHTDMSLSLPSSLSNSINNNTKPQNLYSFKNFIPPPVCPSPLHSHYQTHNSSDTRSGLFFPHTEQFCNTGWVSYNLTQF